MIDPVDQPLDKINIESTDEEEKVYEEVMITVYDQSDLTNLILKITSLIVMFFPLVASMYSKVLRDCNSFTKPIDRL